MADEHLGQRLKRLRKKQGLTQAELAYRVDVHEMTVRRWETGTRQLENIREIKKLAAVLHVTEDELLNGESGQNAWILRIKIAENNEEKFLDMSKKVPTISNVTCTPNGPMLALSGGWDLWLNAENLKGLIKQIKMARELVLDNGRKMGWVKDTDGGKK